MVAIAAAVPALGEPVQGFAKVCTPLIVVAELDPIVAFAVEVVILAADNAFTKTVLPTVPVTATSPVNHK